MFGDNVHAALFRIRDVRFSHENPFRTTSFDDIVVAGPWSLLVRQIEEKREREKKLRETSIEPLSTISKKCNYVDHRGL